MSASTRKGGSGATQNPPHASPSSERNVGLTVQGDRPRRYKVARISLYAPSGRRTCWWAAYLCPYCGGGHFARLRSEVDARGVRRSACGRLLWLVVARTYHGKRAAR